ncbi:MAG: hypothetical protein AAGD38_20095, partial [Acidobacteriota bacterium]
MAEGQVSPARQWCIDNGIGQSFRVVLDESNQKVGFLCAVRPSATDPSISDRNPVADVADLDDLTCGYGAHAIGFPGDPDDPMWTDFSGLDDVMLYFVGTYVRPYDTGGYDELAVDPLANPVSTFQDCRRCVNGEWDSANGVCEDPNTGVPGLILDTPDPDPSSPGLRQYES